MLKFTPMRVLDEMKEKEARQQELSTERMKQFQEELYENIGNNSIGDKLDEHNKNIAKIAEAAKLQSDSAKLIAESAEKQAKVAVEKFEKSKNKSKWTLFFTGVSYFFKTLLDNADKIVHFLQKIKDFLRPQ